MQERISSSLISDASARILKHKILLVEDNPVNQKVALRMLSKLGYEADVAHNGTEAVEALSQYHYDLIFMDIMMPIMDGIEATRQIRISYPNHPPYIIALTANVTEEDRQKCFGAGMDDFMSKPITLDRLAKVLAVYAE